MNIVLIGYRGSGKSSVAELVAKHLNMEHLAMDEMIVKKVGMSIPEIVDKHGWPKFRDMESEVARELSGLDNIIIDTGGGVIEREENVEALQANSVVIWLKASVGKIVSRIQNSNQRPSLTGSKTFTEEVQEVLERRTPLYRQAAQYEIDTNGMTSKQVADRIIEIWRTTSAER